MVGLFAFGQRRFDMASNDGGAVKGKIGGGKFHAKGDMTDKKGEVGDHLKHHKKGMSHKKAHK